MTLCHILPERRGWVNMMINAKIQMQKVFFCTKINAFLIRKSVNFPYIYIYIRNKPFSSFLPWRIIYPYLEGTEAKLGIFYHNNKRFYKTRIIFILENKQQNKKKNLLNIAVISSIVESTCLRNDLHAFKIDSHRHFIPSLLNSNLKRTNIWMGSCICFVF